MITTITNKITKENKLSYIIEVITFDNNIEIDRFKIPVIDVRDGAAERGLVNEVLKANNFSRFTKSTFSVIGKSYQVSHKKEL